MAITRVIQAACFHQSGEEQQVGRAREILSQIDLPLHAALLEKDIPHSS